MVQRLALARHGSIRTDSKGERSENFLPLRDAAQLIAPETLEGLARTRCEGG